MHLFARADRIITYADYFLEKLSGEYAIDYTMASRTMAFDCRSKGWDPGLLNRLDVPPSLFSEPVVLRYLHCNARI